MSGEVIEDQEVGEGRAERVHLPLKYGRDDERRHPVILGVDVTTIMKIVALERGVPVEELIIIREGEVLPLDLGTIIGPEYPHHRRHHIHHKFDVKVIVYYNAGDKHHEFKRYKTVEDALTWALSVFPIDKAIAPEFELALHGSKDELPTNEHVGHLAGHAKELELDLIRGTFVNGSA